MTIVNPEVATFLTPPPFYRYAVWFGGSLLASLVSVTFDALFRLS